MSVATCSWRRTPSYVSSYCLYRSKYVAAERDIVAAVSLLTQVHSQLSQAATRTSSQEVHYIVRIFLYFIIRVIIALVVLFRIKDLSTFSKVYTYVHILSCKRKDV